MSAQSEEQILVVPTATIEAIGAFEGFESDVDRYLPAILSSGALSFRPRSAMEQDPSFKQLIPYCVLQCDRDDAPQIFTYTRGSGQGEARLHAKRSMGIGGHISVEDAEGGSDPYLTGMQRELDEEVQIASKYHQECVGLIYDPSTEVGRVHLGIVHRFRLEQPRVEPNEHDISNAGFVSVDELTSHRDRLETWSQLCLDHLF